MNANESALQQEMDKLQKNETDFEDLKEELSLTIGDELLTLKEQFNKMVSKSGFEYSFEDFIKDEIWNIY